MSEQLFTRLRLACLADWLAYVEHPFVKGIGAGTLPEASFRHYLVQDYLFLIHFARAYGLAAYKGETIADIRAASTGLAAIVDRELQLHVDYCAGWGIGEADMAVALEDSATVAYTRFVLERGMAGDLLDLQVALAPCVLGYAEIGRALSEAPATVWVGNPYRAWIECYAADEYQQVAQAHAAHMDQVMARRGGGARFDGLITVFRQATRLEAAFWDMGLSLTA